MFLRILSFAIVPALFGALGAWLSALQGFTLGWVLGSAFWFAADYVRGSRVLEWLREPTHETVPVVGGVWAEVAARARRQLRARESATAESNRRLAEFLAAIQAAPNGVVLLDRDSRIEWCNQTAANHFGFDAQRDVLQHIKNLVRDPAFTAYLAEAAPSNEISMSGSRSTASRPVRLSVQLHPYGQGRRLLLSNDVTALEQADAMRRDFVANVSHEIRTPLTVLSGFVETLQTLPLEPEERTRYLALMAQQSLRMQSLVSDLLTLSRLEGSPLPTVREFTPIASLMAQCEQEARALSALARDGVHKFSFDPGPPCALSGVPSELLSACSNLVNNAVRYTPAAGSVRVRWRILNDGRGEFSVNDSGPGIAPEHVPRLTERFYRVDRSRSRDTGGTGLGLAIVKHVAQRHGGELVIESALGRGSMFALRFPASRVQFAEDERLVA